MNAQSQLGYSPTDILAYAVSFWPYTWANVQHPAVVQRALPTGLNMGGFAHMYFDYAEVLISCIMTLWWNIISPLWCACPPM